MRAEKLVPTSSQQDSVPSSAGPEQGVDPQGEATVSRQGPASPAGREASETDWQVFCWADPKQNWEVSPVAFFPPPLQGKGPYFTCKFTLLPTKRACVFILLPNEESVAFFVIMLAISVIQGGGERSTTL